MVAVTGTVVVDIVITTAAIGMPIRGGCTRYLHGMAAVTIGRGNAVADGGAVETIVVVCDTTVVGDIQVSTFGGPGRIA